MTGDRQSIGPDIVHLTGHQECCPGASVQGYLGRRSTAQAAQRVQNTRRGTWSESNKDGQDSAARSSIFKPRICAYMTMDVRREFAEEAVSTILSAAGGDVLHALT